MKNFGFELLVLTLAETHSRLAICEIMWGERCGALFGFQFEPHENGFEVGFDLFWTGLFR